MRTLAILRKDLIQIVRDRRALVFLLLMPLAFTLFFGLAFSGLGSGDGRLQLGIVDDDGSPTATQFVSWLSDSPTVRPERLDRLHGAYAADLVRRGDDAAVVRIPPGWGASVVGGAPEPLALITDAASATGLAALHAVDAVLGRFLSAERTASEAADLVASRSATPAATLRTRALRAALTDWRDPPVRVVIGAVAGAVAPARSGGAFGSNPYDQASPGMIVQFAVYGLLLTAMVLVIERKQGAHRRLLATPTPRSALVAGHGLAMFSVVLAQIVVLEAFGQLAFGVDYLQRPWAILALTLALALWSASLGMLIGAFARSEQQVVASGLLAMFLLSGLGGAWFPLEITGPTFAAVGHLTPTAWAMDAYRAILLRGAGATQVLTPVLVLLGFTALFFGVAVARLRRISD